MAGASDAAILDRATQLRRVLFTQDDDLLTEARRRDEKGLSFSGVVFAAQPRTTIGSCVKDLELIAKALRPSELENNFAFLPL